MKKLVIAAGTGFLGQVLAQHFEDKCSEIVILTRGKSRVNGKFTFVTWDAKTMTGWQRHLENADVLINLAGKSVDCRYNKQNKNEILLSRTQSTEILNEAILTCENPPKHWLNSSTATIYRHSTDKQMDEILGETGDDFSMNVAKAWEKSFFETETPLTCKTALRTSIVLGKNGGAFLPLKNLTKMGFGGKQGDGKQFISWIHEKDFARAIEFAVQRKQYGIINIVSPTPVKNATFMKSLRKALQVRTGIPIGKRLLEMGAKIIGTETELVLKSRNVIPKRLLENGFKFEFDDLQKCFENLIRK